MRAWSSNLSAERGKQVLPNRLYWPLADTPIAADV
jgi:hypothetical protein